MRKPEQIASDIVGERTRGSTATIAEVLAIVRDAIKEDRAQRKNRKPDYLRACEFVSPCGIVCQVRGGHKVHQAWNENGIPTLKMEG